MVGTIAIWDPVRKIVGDLVDIFSHKDVFIGRSKTWYAPPLLINSIVYDFKLITFPLVLVTYKSTECISLTSTFASSPSCMGRMIWILRSLR